MNVGITGGIGSGKSMIAKVFEVLGIPVYYADDAAKRLMNEDEDLQQQLIASFGDAIYTNRLLNRKVLATLVFNDTKKLSLLNTIVHPVTIQDGEEWTKKQVAPYTIKEAALIFESGSDKYLDKVIGVYAPAPIRLQRVMLRDNLPEEAVKARMEKQMDEEIKMGLCDYIINNNGQELVIPQVMKIHEMLLALTK
ncbi:MAG: dephospho-CoA kinase [Ferruginibacter sp.]|nr:dephospho-CoA kinase [Ferruginibacter sp.]